MERRQKAIEATGLALKFKEIEDRLRQLRRRERLLKFAILITLSLISYMIVTML